MGVDFLICNYCGETFPDCGHFVRCECGEHWCSEDCAEEDGYEEKSCKLGYDCKDNECDKYCFSCDNHIEKSCKYCREEDFNDLTLLEFALDVLGKTREDLINDYKNNRKED